MLNSPASLVVAIILFALLGHPTERAGADEWYETVPFSIHDPFRIGPYHSVANDDAERLLASLPKVGWNVVTARQVYAILSTEEVSILEAASVENGFNGFPVSKLTVLDSKKAGFWSDFFRKKATIGRVPFIVSFAGIFSAPASVVSCLADILLSQGDEKTYRCIELATLISEGGEFRDTARIVRDDQNRPYLHKNLFYIVKVGNEVRHVLVHSSRYAVRVE